MASSSSLASSRSAYANGVRLDGVRCRVAERRGSARGRPNARASSDADGDGAGDGDVSRDGTAQDDSASSASASASASVAKAGDEQSEDGLKSETSGARSRAADEGVMSENAGENARSASAKMISDEGDAVTESSSGDEGPSGTVRLRRAGTTPSSTSTTSGGTIRKRVDPSRGAVKRPGGFAREALYRARNEAAQALENIRMNQEEAKANAAAAAAASEANTSNVGDSSIKQAAGEAMALAKVTADALKGARTGGPITMDEWTMAMSTALSAVWRELWYRWSSRLKQAAKWAFVASAVLSAAFHYIVGPAFISPRLPMIGNAASSAIGRPVRVGRCKRLSFMGVLGLGQFVEIGPVVLGPSESEKSIVEVDTVKISYDIFRSILRRKLVTEVRLDGVTATLRQGANNSWFGYPEDTSPLSSRPTIKVATSSSGGVAAEVRVVRIENGVAALHIVGDPEPRKLNNLQGTAVINHKGRVDIDITTRPSARKTPPLERATTMLAPEPVRHLRGSMTPSERKSLAVEESRGDNGGQLRVFASLSPPQQRPSSIFRSRVYPDLKVRAQLNNMSAAVLERVIPSLPIDMHGGRLDGEIRISCTSPSTWTFPDFGGQIKGKNLWFHFFDSTDDFADTAVDLVFEGQRMYIHGGEGHFGNVPLTLTGDLDLNPIGGEYRLSAQVSPVEVHKLRETLGVRPIPRPVAGSVKGFLYCSGPLEQPVFTGRAETTVPADEDLNIAKPGTEMAWSEDAIKAAAHEGAVAAYDRVPFKSANAVFSVDVKKGAFSLHSAEAQLVDGGRLRGSGRVSTKPTALFDPDALNIEGTAVDIDFLRLAKRLVPGDAPPWLDRVCPSSPAIANAKFTGALSAPVLDAQWSVEEDEYKGSVTMAREGIITNVETPVLDLKASIATTFQPLEVALKAVTVEEAIAAGRPTVTDAEADLMLNGADIAAWVGEDNVETMGAPDRVRLRIGGRTRVKGTFKPAVATDGEDAKDALPSFTGDVQLDNLRINKLEFAPKMNGKLNASSSGLFLNAKNRADEIFEASVEGEGKASMNIRRNNLKISADIDDFAGNVEIAGLSIDDLEIASLRGKVENAHAKIDLRERVGEGSVQIKQPRLSGIGGELLEADIQWSDRVVSLQRASLKQVKSRYEADGEYCLPNAVWDALPGSRAVPEAVEIISSEVVTEDIPEFVQPVIDIAPLTPEVVSEHEVVEKKWWQLSKPKIFEKIVNHITKKPEGVFVSMDLAEVMDVPNVKESPATAATNVDEPVASARADADADVKEIEVDKEEPFIFKSHEEEERTDLVEDADTKLEMRVDSKAEAKPKKSKNTFKKVLRQARNVVKQNRPAEKIVKQVTTLASLPHETEFDSSVSGAWRFRLAVPRADIEEMLPALRIVTDIRKGDTPEEYGRAKTAFLKGVEDTGYAIVDLARQVSDVTIPSPKVKAEAASELEEVTEKNVEATANALPGLQDLRGEWHGMIQATGGGDDAEFESPQPAEAVLFDIAGADWQWGPYSVEHVEAQGAANASDGLKLKRLELRSDAASLSVMGAIGGESQDATFALRDLPAPLAGKLIGPLLPDKSLSDFPTIGGDLLIQGHLGGSVAKPEGEVMMRLREGRIGAVKLKSAEARAELNDSRRAEFEAEASPAEGTGLVRIAGTIPLPEAEDQSLAVDWRVREQGMTLLTAFVPEVAEWQSGAAEMSLHVRGTPAAPVYDGVLEVRKARINSPLLSRPIYPANATVRIQRNTLYADDVEARSGKGIVRIKGAMPVLKPRRSGSGETWEGLVARADTAGGVKMTINGLDLRARNIYNGQLNANMVAKGTLTAPELSGELRFSRGTAFVQQQQTSPDEAPSQQAKSGTLSTKQDSRGVLAGILERAARANDPRHGEGAAPENELMTEKNLEKLQNLRLQGLKLVVGPEMSVVYPFVLNFGVAGELTIDGYVDAGHLKPNGTLQFERGDVNLVATQIRLDRDHPNKIVFTPDQGLDPYVDVSFLGSDIRALIQGPASRWTDNLILTSSAQATPGEGDATLSPSEAARIFEGQLVESLLEQDGKIAFSNLASTTLNSLMPKIEAGGNVGKARWRLTAAPSLPGLLSLDPGMDPFSNTSQFTLGSEAEISFGDSLTATLSRNLDADEMRTQLSLMYKLTSKLRLQLKSLSASATRVLFEFSTKD